MGHRTLKRVPLDFSWPLHKVWDGYLCHLGGPCPGAGKTCFNGYTAAGKWLESLSRLIALIGDEAAAAWEETEPPTGDGWQLWETCSEGSPVSPVFATVEELAEWCAVNATTFADFKATREQWLEMFSTEDGADTGSMAIMKDGKFGAAVDFGMCKP